MTVIITKNSSTASAVPTTADLVKGELAVNVTDKRIFTENASTQIVELGTNPSTVTTATATVTGTLTANGTFASNNAVVTGGSVNSTPIGATTPSTVRGSTVTATTGFVGGLTGNVVGNVTGNVTGNVVGNVTGDLTGNVTASSGTSTVNNLVVNGTVDFTNTRLTDVAEPVAGSDAATKTYVDTSISAVIDGAPAALDTLNELAAALNDDASFHTTVTNSLAGKLPLAGGTMTGQLSLGANKIVSVADPTLAQDVATKAYVDAADSTGLPLSGGTMSGAIAMGTNKITGLGTPTDAADATTKAYTDSILGSATSAAVSAAAASTSESNAATSASNASTSETNALNSANAAASSYDQFDDRYLGDKASDPTLDNDGNALLTGALYFNTTSDVMKVYDGSAWNIAAISSASPTFTGTVTADGLTVEDGGTIQLTKNTVSAGDSLGIIEFHDEDGAATADSGKFQLQAFRGADKDAPDFKLIGSDASGTLRTRLQIENNGDISFYEDTGTTPKFFWDASEEALGIGTSSPSSSYSIDAAKGIRSSGAAPNFTLQESDASNQSWLMGSYTGTFAVRDITVSGTSYPFRIEAATPSNTLYLDSSGNVGIGTTSPNLNGFGTGTNGLEIADATLAGIRLNGNAADSMYLISGSAKHWVYGRGAVPMTFSTNGAEAMRIDSSGNVGIGTSSPATNLQIESSTGGNAYLSVKRNNATSTDLRIAAENGSTGISSVGAVPMVFYTNSVERMRIDSSGNLLVGTTDSAPAVSSSEVGVALSGSLGYVAASRSTGASGFFNRLTTDGDIVNFNKDGTTVGSIGSDAGVTIYMDGGGARAGIYMSGSGVLPRYNGALANNSTDLGASNRRFKDLYLGGGVYLGGTGAANKLDDYEEGTWTPTILSAGGGSNGSALLINCTYTKTGNRVMLTGTLLNINTTSMTAGGFRVGGLPFAAVTSTYSQNLVSLGSNQITTDEGGMYGIVSSGGTAMVIYNEVAAAAKPIVTIADITSGDGDLFISMMYQTTA